MLPLQAAAALPVEVVRGVYLGLLTGVLPALVAWSMGFLFRYVTGVSIPAFAVVGLGVAVAGANGGLLALVDPTVTESANAPALVTALLVVMMLALYAHNRGDALGAAFPRRLSLRSLGERTLPGEVTELVGGRRQVRVRVVGEVADVEGYPPLPAPLRAAVRAGEWTFPADLPVSELETRVADRLRTEFDLADVSVAIDEHARATVAAAPPFSGVSRRVPAGERAVSVPALVPTGLARGDEVTVLADGLSVEGTVVSARSDGGSGGGSGRGPASVAGTDPAAAEDDATGRGDDGAVTVAPAESAPTADGGEGRVTVSVPRDEARTLLRADRGRLVVAARGTHREYELLSLLGRAGHRVERLSVRAGGPLDGATIGDAAVRDAHGVALLAVHRDGGWLVGPRGTTALSAGDELFAAGGRDALARFREAVA